VAQDLAVDVLGAAKNGSVKVFIVKVFTLPIVKARAGHVVSFPPIIPRCPETQSAYMFIHTLAPQATPRVEPELPLSLWIRVRHGMLARMVTVSGHRGPFETCCSCCRPSGSCGRRVMGEHVKDVAAVSIVIFQWRRTGSRGPSSSNPGCVHAVAGAQRRRHIGTPSRTTTTTAAAAAAAASALRTQRRTLRRTWRRTWPSGPGRRVPSSPRHHRCRRRLCAARAEMGAQLGSSVALAVLGA